MDGNGPAGKREMKVLNTQKAGELHESIEMDSNRLGSGIRPLTAGRSDSTGAIPCGAHQDNGGSGPGLI
jgi:hypothetical protein